MRPITQTRGAYAHTRQSNRVNPRHIAPRRASRFPLYTRDIITVILAVAFVGFIVWACGALYMAGFHAAEQVYMVTPNA